MEKQWVFFRPCWECQNACHPRFASSSTTTTAHTFAPIYPIVGWRSSLRKSCASATVKDFATISTLLSPPCVVGGRRSTRGWILSSVYPPHFQDHLFLCFFDAMVFSFWVILSIRAMRGAIWVVSISFRLIVRFVVFPHDFIAEVSMDAKTASSGRLSQKNSI